MNSERADFLDLMALLIKHKKKIVGITILMGCLTFMVAMLIPSSYRASAVLQIGQVKDLRGISRLIQPPGETKAFILTYGDSLREQMRESPMIPKLDYFSRQDLKVGVSQTGNILTVETRTYDISLGVDYVSKICSAIKMSHDKLLTDWILENRGELEDIKDSIKKIETHAEPRINKEIQQRTAWLEKDKYLSETLIKRYEAQALRHQDHLRFLTEHLSHLINEKKQLTAEILAMQKAEDARSLHKPQRSSGDLYLSSLKEQVTWGIPGRISAVEQDMADTETRIAEIENRINQSEFRRMKTSDETTEMIEKLDRKLNALDNKKEALASDLKSKEESLSKITHTEFLIKPISSKTPVAPNIRKIVLLGVVFGFILSIFIAYLTEFYKNLRQS